MQGVLHRILNHILEELNQSFIQNTRIDVPKSQQPGEAMQCKEELRIHGTSAEQHDVCVRAFCAHMLLGVGEKKPKKNTHRTWLFTIRSSKNSFPRASASGVTCKNVCIVRREKETPRKRKAAKSKERMQLRRGLLVTL